MVLLCCSSHSACPTAGVGCGEGSGPVWGVLRELGCGVSTALCSRACCEGEPRLRGEAVISGAHCSGKTVVSGAHCRGETMFSGAHCRADPRLQAVFSRAHCRGEIVFAGARCSRPTLSRLTLPSRGCPEGWTPTAGRDRVLQGSLLQVSRLPSNPSIAGLP